MKIIEKSNLEIKKIKMKADHELHPNLMKPLDSLRSGFLMVVNGPSGSGKTNFLINVLNTNPDPITKQRRSLKGLFHNIYLVRPSLHTLKNNIFEDLDTTFEHFDEEFLDTYKEMCDKQKDDFEEGDEIMLNLLILDDCSDDIRDKSVYKKFIKLINNRRHCNTSIIVLSQNIIQLSPAIRKNMSHLVTFFPKSLAEEESIYAFSKQKKKDMIDFYKFIFDAPHQFLLIDMTLKTGKFIFYKCFDKIEF